MTRISRCFSELRNKGEKALVLYLTAGDPSLKKTLEIIPELEKAGADLMEIGVPFSDPSADGPILRAAAGRALQNGSDLAGTLALVAGLRRRSEIPVVLFSYFHPLRVYGPEQFSHKAKESGVDGILVADLPFEESWELRRFTDPEGLDFISPIAPATTVDRLRRITERARGFLYYISIVGLTGTVRPDLATLRSGVASVRKISDLPLVVGFGLSEPEQVREVAPLADGVVVGSALVRMIFDCEGHKDRMSRVFDFVYRLKKALGPDQPVETPP
jgi:tryptophan synthase alpha chain